MSNNNICFDCNNLNKKVTVQTVNSNVYNYYCFCSKKGFVDCKQQINCNDFEQSQKNIEDINYLFSDEEMKAMFTKIKL